MELKSILKELCLPNLEAAAVLVSRLDNLEQQAMMFGLEVDTETLSLVKPRPKIVKKPWLEAWKEKNADKQWDHENQNKDGGK